jgi:hypothetical protein
LLIFYDNVLGSGHIYAVDTKTGGLGRHVRQYRWSKDWDTILAYGGGAEENVVFYDKESGALSFYRAIVRGDELRLIANY